MNDSAISKRIDALLVQMTPEEKAGQLCQFFAFTPNDTAISDAIAAGLVGSILVVRDPVELDRLQHIAVEKIAPWHPVTFWVRCDPRTAHDIPCSHCYGGKLGFGCD
jgi:beta-glucosidase